MHIYVHIPFCESICSYCDFFRVKDTGNLKEKFIDSLKKEKELYTISNVSTIYIGGGTPSSLTMDELDKVLSLFDMYHPLEYTLEANPDSLSKDKIKILKKHGINRISLGVQTLDENILKLLNRKHTINDVKRVIHELHDEGIHNISIDMMYGLPYQSVEMFQKHLQEVTKWDIQHISIYSLTIEENSEFGRKHMELIDNDLEGQMYEEGVRILEENGFSHYEVANFAKKGYESKHNLGYWNYEEYIGLGPGAVGFVDNVRYDNTKNFISYFEGNYREHEECIEYKERLFEYIMVGLRKAEGISIQKYNEHFHTNMEEIYHGPISHNIKLGYLEIENGYLKTTKQGMEMLHNVLIEFMLD